MAYEKQNWVDYPLETTPISSERLIHIEDGIYNAAENADDAVSGALADAYPQVSYMDIDGSQLFYTCAVEIAGETVDGTEVSGSNTLTLATKDSLLNAKAVTDSKADSIRYENIINLTPGSMISPSVLYLDQEHTEQTFEWAENTIPAKVYYLNDESSFPQNISSTDEPTQLQIYRGSDIMTLYLYPAGTDAYISGAVGNYISNTSGQQVLVSILQSYSGTAIVILGLDMTNHIINQINVGQNLGNGNYIYYPCNLIYDSIPRKAPIIDDTQASSTTTYSSDKIESLLDGTTIISPNFLSASGPSFLVYTDPNDSSIKSYTNGGPYSTGYSVIDYLNAPSTLTLVSQNATFNLIDATTDIITDINSEYDWIKIADVSSLGVEYTDCYIALLGTRAHSMSPNEIIVYASVLNVDTRQRTAELLCDNQGQPYPITFSYEAKAKCIDDTTASELKTYSSAKIEQLIADLQAQINNLT